MASFLSKKGPIGRNKMFPMYREKVGLTRSTYIKFSKAPIGRKGKLVIGNCEKAAYPWALTLFPDDRILLWIEGIGRIGRIGRIPRAVPNERKGKATYPWKRCDRADRAKPRAGIYCELHAKHGHGPSSLHSLVTHRHISSGSTSINHIILS